MCFLARLVIWTAVWWIHRVFLESWDSMARVNYAQRSSNRIFWRGPSSRTHSVVYSGSYSHKSCGCPASHAKLKVSQTRTRHRPPTNAQSMPISHDRRQFGQRLSSETHSCFANINIRATIFLRIAAVLKARTSENFAITKTDVESHCYLIPESITQIDSQQRTWNKNRNTSWENAHVHNHVRVHVHDHTRAHEKAERAEDAASADAWAPYWRWGSSQQEDTPPGSFWANRRPLKSWTWPRESGKRSRTLISVI